MKNSKKLAILLFITALLFSCGSDNSDNENTTTTAANTTTTKQENNSKNTETKSQTENTIQGIRYGNDTVGYVTKPENWLEFTAVQLSIDSANIVTLDILSKDAKANSEKAAYVLMQKYLNEGIPKENITLDPVDINGYQGTSLTIK